MNVTSGGCHAANAAGNELKTEANHASRGGDMLLSCYDSQCTPAKSILLIDYRLGNRRIVVQFQDRAKHSSPLQSVPNGSSSLLLTAQCARFPGGISYDGVNMTMHHLAPRLRMSAPNAWLRSTDGPHAGRRAETECDGTRKRTGGEVKGEKANGGGS